MECDYSIVTNVDRDIKMVVGGAAVLCVCVRTVPHVVRWDFGPP